MFQIVHAHDTMENGPSFEMSPIPLEDNTNILCTVFTLNCWGIPCVSKDRRTRIYAIAKHLLSSSKIDFVCLQEVWSMKDYLFISKKCSTQYPYSHYFNSFVTGSGLCVLSKYPILEVYYHQWPINGYAHKITQGDWFGGKGVGLCKIQLRDLIVNLYTTHLHAEYDYESCEYLTHRLLQAFDTSQFIKLTSGGADIAILAGDLNTEPQDLAIQILNRNAQLIDSFDTAQKKSPACLGTNESYRNSYAPKKELKRIPEGKRIDYVLYKNCSDVKMEVLDYVFPLPDRVPGTTFSYSDHEAVQVQLRCVRTGAVQGKATDMEEEELRSTLNKCLTVCNTSLTKLVVDKHKYLAATILFALLLLAFLFIELFWGRSEGEQLSGVGLASSVVCFNLVKIICTAAFIFALIMATAWNSIERNAVLAAKFSMTLILDRLYKGSL